MRHNIKFRSICGYNAAVDQEVCDDWKQRKLLPVLIRFDPSNIFNADETELYWRLLPDKTHAVAEVCTGGKKSKERVTVLVCANCKQYSKNGCRSGMQSSPVANNRKIALFIDNCSAHPRIQGLKSIEIIFFPSNTTSEIQPCDQGIIKALKVPYRKNMVKRLITTINIGSTAANFKITLLDGLQMLRRAWESVTESMISNCFHKG